MAEVLTFEIAPSMAPWLYQDRTPFWSQRDDDGEVLDWLATIDPAFLPEKRG